MKMNKIIKAVVIMLCIFIILYILRLLKNKENKQSINSKIVENQSTGEYIIYDEEKNEKVRTNDETLIEILKQDPEYDLNLITNSSIENKIEE